MSRPELDKICERAEHEVAERDTPGGIAHWGIKAFCNGRAVQILPTLRKSIQGFVHQSIIRSHDLEGIRQLRKDLKTLLDYVQVLEEALDCFRDTDFEGKRQALHAAEDPEVLALCERIGYGAVMDSAARQWRRKDAVGAFTTGPCVGVAKKAHSVIQDLKEAQ